jgi:hypothetical protein
MWKERDSGGHIDEHMNVYGMNGTKIIWPESLKDDAEVWEECLFVVSFFGLSFRAGKCLLNRFVCR